MRSRDAVAGGVCLALGLAAAWATAALPERSLPNTPGPAFFPWVVTAALIGLSVLLVARDLLTRPDAGERRAAPLLPAGRAPAALILIAAFALYIALLPRLGFVLATPPFFAALMGVYGERRPSRLLAISLIATAAFYFAFRHGFEIILPQGLLTGLVP